jgi:Tol biopolymer transport system component
VVKRLRAGSDDAFISTDSVAWSPDGRQIAFISGAGGSYDADYHAQVISADGRFQEPVLDAPKPRGNDELAVWMPGRTKRLLLDSDNGMYVAAGRRVRRIAVEGGSPVPSPDGRTLMFLRWGSYPSGDDVQTSAIFVTDIEGHSLHQLTQVGQKGKRRSPT